MLIKISAKIVQTEWSTKRKQSFRLLIPRCSLSYLKIVQTEWSTKRKQSFQVLIPRCSLSYLKIVQTEWSTKRKQGFGLWLQNASSFEFKWRNVLNRMTKRFSWDRWQFLIIDLKRLLFCRKNNCYCWKNVFFIRK